jgi:hypothetical protein
MWFALGAATSLLQSLTSSSTSQTSSTAAAGQSQGASNPFAIDSTSPGPANTGFTPAAGGGSQISPQTMSALIGAQEQSGSTSSAPTSQSAALQDLFSQIDGNGDGEISKSEFESALGAGGTNVAAADNVFGQLDTNGDGNVSLDELKNALEGAGGHHGGHHHMHSDAGSSGSTDGSSGSTSADGSTDPLMQALTASSTSAGNGSNGLSSSLIPVDQAHLMPISLSASSYNAIEAMVQRSAQNFAASAANSLSVNI